MKTHTLRIGVLAVAILINVGCQKSEPLLEQGHSIDSFIGYWKNVGSNEDNIMRLIITRTSTNQISVRFLNSCLPNICIWAAPQTTLQDGEDGVLELKLTQTGQTIQQELTISSTGKLQIDQRKIDDRTQVVSEETFYFSKTKSESLL